MRSAPSATAAGSGPSWGATPFSAKKPTRSNARTRSRGSMPAPSRKSVALSLLLVGVGVILGLVVASDLGWLPFGHAVPDAPPVTKPAVVAPPAAGSDRNFVEV